MFLPYCIIRSKIKKIIKKFDGIIQTGLSINFIIKKSFYQDNYVEDDDDGDYETEKEVYDDGEEDYGSEADDDVPSLDGGFSFSGEETKSKFTSYSMSSSVIRRNNQVCFLFCPCNCHHSMFMG